MKTIADWNGEQLQVAESNGGVLAVIDPLRGMMCGGLPCWPPPELVQKLYKSRQQRAYSGEDLTAVTKTLGFYCDLQSLHSEDAITWSVFGPIAHASDQTRSKFVGELFSEISSNLPEPEAATVSLWRRIPHPDNLVPGGPEIDFLIATDRVVVFGEAKWRSSVGQGQGKNRSKSQIDLRKEFFQKYGARFFPLVTHFVVLGASLGDPVVQELDLQIFDNHLLLRDLDWARLCSLESHPHRDELLRYLDWKKKHSKL